MSRASAAVLHVNSSTESSTSPTMRIARFVSSELKIPLIHDLASAKKHEKARFDTLYVKYGMLKFSDHRDEAVEIYKNARRVVNLENDYLFALDKRFRAPDEVWSTVEGRTHYVNWNILTRQPFEIWRQRPVLPEPEKQGLIYYGAFREDRAKDFVKYFDGAPYPVTVSSFRGGKKFEEACKGVRTVGAFREAKAPAQWPLTIYIEDEASHKLYCSPATRFYECVQMGLAQVIDKSAVNTLEQAGFTVPMHFIVDSQRGVKHALRNWRDLRKDQMKLWFRDYSVDLRRQLQAAVKASS